MPQAQRPTLAVLTLIALSLLVIRTMMIDVVHIEGDHTSFLVIAPYPTLGFHQGGGEEGAWARAHPGEREPWWLSGHYVRLCEVTNG